MQSAVNRTLLQGLFLACLFFGLYSSDGAWVMYLPVSFILGLFHFQALSSKSLQYTWVNQKDMFVWSAILTSFILLGSVLSPFPERSFFELYSPAILFLMLFFSRGLSVSTSKTLLPLTLLPAVIAAIQGLSQRIIGHELPHAQFFDPNLLASYLLAGSLLSFGLLINSIQVKAVSAHKIGYALVLSLLVSAGLCTQSRGGWLSAMVSLIVTSFFLAKNLKIELKHIKFTLVVLTIVGVAAVTPKLIRHFAHNEPFGVSIQSRVAVLKSTAAMIEDHPVAGVGMGLWADAYSKYRLPEDSDSSGGRAHNDYLEAIGAGGILGGGLFMLIPFFWLRQLVKAKGVSLHNPWLLFGILSAVGVMVLQAFVNFIFHQLGYCLIAGFLLGIPSVFINEKQFPGSEEISPPSIKARICAFILIPILLGGTLYGYISEIPSYAMMYPTGFEARELGHFLTKTNLVRLTKLNPGAPSSAFYLADKAQQAAQHDLDLESKTRDCQEAWDYYTLAQKSGPYFPSISFRLAIIGLNFPGFDEAHRVALAEKQLLHALAIDPAYAPAAVLYSDILVSKGDTAGAVRVLDRAARGSNHYLRSQIEAVKESYLAKLKR